MTKKDGTKESSRKKAMTKAELEKKLIDNFVNLQKVLTNLSVKFDNLSENITKLLQLFEISAKSFAEKQENGELLLNKQPEKDQELINKINTLLDQNKTIAKGLTNIMEKNLNNRAEKSWNNQNY
jgi:hypothetical protein